MNFFFSYLARIFPSFFPFLFYFILFCPPLISSFPFTSLPSFFLSPILFTFLFFLLFYLFLYGFFFFVSFFPLFSVLLFFSQFPFFILFSWLLPPLPLLSLSYVFFPSCPLIFFFSYLTYLPRGLLQNKENKG